MLWKLAVCFFLFNLSIVYGFGQDNLGLPAEHDLNRYNGFLNNWKWLYGNNDSEDEVADEIVENISDNQHRVRKRSADINNVTGHEDSNSTTHLHDGTISLQPSVSPTNESLTNSTADKTEPKNTIEVSPPLAVNATDNVTNIAESTQSILTTTELSKDSRANETTNTTGSPTVAEAETATSIMSTEAINTTTTENRTEPAEGVKEVDTKIKHTDKNATEDKVVLAKSPDENSTIPTFPSTTNHPETHLKTFVDDKKARKATEKEHMDHHQSGNAVVTKGDKTMSETDMELGKAAAHESIKTGHEANPPKEGASSTTNASSTGNDTKIIIFLGVAVAVVGVAAVGYNYTRKRRRTNRRSPRVGQNGDVETGKEMKPLMRHNPETPEIKKEAEVKIDESK